jgi:Cell wall-active antibiotics response 4TMS YvqF/Domain of unknown function (DUF5668)
VHAEEYIRFWPASLIGVGLVKLWHSREGSGGGFGGFVFTVAGSWLLLEQLSVVRLSFWQLWPTLLVFFGGFLVWQGLSRPRAVRDADTNSAVSAMAVLGGVMRGNNSRAFRGGDLTAVMGGCELDLRHAAIDGEAVIDVFALWGGIEIRVPEDWSVESRVVPILGGVDDKTRPPQGASRCLRAGLTSRSTFCCGCSWGGCWPRFLPASADCRGAWRSRSRSRSQSCSPSSVCRPGTYRAECRLRRPGQSGSSRPP